MLQNCIEIFQKSGDIDKRVLDTYTPATGTYLILKENEEGFEIQDLLEISQDRKTKSISISEEERSKIAKLDYYSKLVDMNKPIDQKKIVQSNNYLSFFIKKESLTNGKLTQEIINNYYEVLLKPQMKYEKSKEDKELYDLISQKVGEVNQEKLQKIKKWVNENIFQLPIEINGKDYLKLFFLCTNVSVEKEGMRYILPNIYNKNEYNVNLEGKIYGLPNENMGLNAKKPYLENKSRKYKVPALVNANDILIRKKFFDYLWNQVCKGNANLYFNLDTNEIYECNSNISLSKSFQGYFMRLRKDKNEAAIMDMDMLTCYQPELKKEVYVRNVIGLDTEKLAGHFYGTTRKLEDVRHLIDNEFFSKWLLTNFFTEPNEISLNDIVLKENLLLARNALFNWFYKGYENGAEAILDKITLNVIKNSIANGYYEKAQHQFNTRIALLEHFKGRSIIMPDVMVEIRNRLKEKMNSKEYESINDEKEYYYAVGQVINYFISLNKSTKKNHALFNPFLNLKNDALLKAKLCGLFEKYSYAIETKSIRFKNLFAMVEAYKTEDGIDKDYMLAGYISKSLIYEKREEN